MRYPTDDREYIPELTGQVVEVSDTPEMRALLGDEFVDAVEAAKARLKDKTPEGEE